MLVTDYEIQTANCAGLGWTRLRNRRRCWACAFFTRWTFVFFVVHIERANDEELSGRGNDFVQRFSRCAGRRLKADIDNVALN